MEPWILWIIALSIAIGGMAVAWIGLAQEVRRADIGLDLGELPDIDEAESRHYDYMSDLGAWARGDGPEPKAYWEAGNE